MNLKLVAAVCAALLVGAANASECSAQWSIGFSYSDGHRGHHHHHHGHWHYGYHWYRPYPNYVYVAPPPPTVYVPVATTALPVAQPNLSLSSVSPTTTTNATAATSGNQPAASAQVRSNALPTYQGTGVTIRNPASTGTRVGFVVDDSLQIDLAPGEATPLKEKASYSVAFDRGGDFGTSRRVLGEGVYEFVVTPDGWDLQRAPAAPNLASGTSTETTVRRNELPTTTR